MKKEEEIKYKSLELDDSEYIFETIEQLADMLKEDGYEVNLNFKKKGKFKTNKVIL